MNHRPTLLFTPYRPPALKRGDRATCLFRDCDVIVTGWSDGPICWPRCRDFFLPIPGAGGIYGVEAGRWREGTPPPSPFPASGAAVA
jgi:hypothetical protein